MRNKKTKKKKKKKKAKSWMDMQKKKEKQKKEKNGCWMRRAIGNGKSTRIFGYGCWLLWLEFIAAEDCIENCPASITSLSQLEASAPLIRHSLIWQQASFS